jgi:predicted transcriptional regulator
MEKHYTPAEIAEKLGRSPDTIREWFKDVKGVIKLGKPSRREGKKLVRRYYSLSIPESVLERELAQKTNK